MSNKIAEAVVGVILDAKQYLSEMGDLKARVTSDTREISESYDRMSKSFAGVEKAGRIAFAALSASIGAGVAAAAKFEQQLANVSTLLVGQNIRFMNEYSRSIQDMSVQFGQGTDKLSDGLWNVLSSAIPAANALDVLEVSVIAAEGGFADLNSTVGTVGKLLGAYDLEATEAGNITDWLFTILENGNSTLTEMNGLLPRLAASASMAGLSLDELGAVLSIVTEKGLGGRQAIGSLNAILDIFADSTEQQRDAAEEMGFQLSATWLAANGLRPVLDGLSKATQKQKDDLGLSASAYRALIPLIKDTEKFSSLLAGGFTRTGAAAEAYKKKTDTLIFQLEQLKQASLAALVEFGNMFLEVGKGTGIITKLTNMLVGLAQCFQELSGETKAWIAAAGLAALAVSGLLIVIGPLAIAIGALAAGPIGAVVLALIGAGGLAAAVATVHSALGEFRNPVRDVGNELERMALRVNDQKKAFAESQLSLIGLTEKYESLNAELASGALTSEERAKKEEELRKVIVQIGEKVPGATTAIDQYGRAFSVNIGAVKDFTAAQQRLFVLTMQIQAAEAKLKINELGDKYQVAKDKLAELLPMQAQLLEQTNMLAGADPSSDAGQHYAMLQRQKEDVDARVAGQQKITLAMEIAEGQAKIAEESIAEAMKLGEEAAKGNTDALNAAARAATNAGETNANAAGDIATANQQAAQYTKDAWTDAFDRMARDQGKSTQYILTQIDIQLARLKEAGQTQSEEYKELLDLHKSYTLQYTQRFSEIWDNVFQSFKTGLSGMVEAAIFDWSSLENAAKSMGDSIFASFKKAIADSIVEKMGFDNFLQGNLLEDIPGMFSKMGATVFSGFSGVIEGAAGLVTSLFGGGAGAIGTGGVMAAFQGGGWASQAIAGNVSNAFAAGQAAAAATPGAVVVAAPAAAPVATAPALTTVGMGIGPAIPLAAAAAGWLNALPDIQDHFDTITDSSSRLDDKFDGLASTVGYMVSPLTSFTSDLAGVVGLNVETANALERMATWGAAGMMVGGPLGGALGALGGGVSSIAQSLGIGGQHKPWEEIWNDLIGDFEEGTIRQDELFAQLYLRATNYAHEYYGTQDELLNASMETRKEFYDTYAQMGVFTEEQLQSLRDALQLYDTAEERAEAAARTQREIMLQSFNDKLWQELRDSPLLHDEVWAADWINTFYAAYDEALATGKDFRDTFADMLGELPGLSQDAIDEMMVAFDKMESDVGEVAVSVVTTWRDMRDEIGASIATAGGNLEDAVATINSLASKFGEEGWDFDLRTELEKIPGLTGELLDILIDAIKEAEERGEKLVLTEDDIAAMQTGYENPEAYPSTGTGGIDGILTELFGRGGVVPMAAQGIQEALIPLQELSQIQIEQMLDMIGVEDTLANRQMLQVDTLDQLVANMLRLAGATEGQIAGTEALTEDQVAMIEGIRNLDWMETIAPFPAWQTFITPVNMADYVITEGTTLTGGNEFIPRSATESAGGGGVVINQQISIGTITGEADVNVIRDKVISAISKGTREALRAAYV